VKRRKKKRCERREERRRGKEGENGLIGAKDIIKKTNRNVFLPKYDILF